MMTFQDVIKAVDALSPEELRQLRAYIDQREGIDRPVHSLSPEERIRRMKTAAAAIREGMTKEQLDEMIEDMNAEYIEPVDEDIWKD
jgi:uncharacterized protein YeeX (DUF496 family)